MITLRTCLTLASAFPMLMVADEAEECTANLQSRNLLSESNLTEDWRIPQSHVDGQADVLLESELLQRAKVQHGLFDRLSDAMQAKEGLARSLVEAGPRPDAPGMCNVTQHNLDFECSYDQYDGPRGFHSARRRFVMRRRGAPRPDGAGRVARLYTTGSPSASKCPLVNELQDGCCFDGLRVFARDSGGFYDPVNLVTGVIGLKHVKMASMELNVPDDPNGDYSEVLHACGEAKDRKLHLHHACVDAFKCHVHSYWDWFYGPGAKGSQADARRILSLTPYAIWGPEHPQKEGHFKDNMISPKDLGFRLVGLFSEPLGNIKVLGAVGVDDDGVMLYQGGDNECYMTFSQTLTISDWVTNLKSSRANWCGAEGLHYGHVEEMRNILNHDVYDCEIRKKLPSCASLTVAGYSLGGGLAQIFSFCANRQSPGRGCSDFALVTWTEADTTKLPDHDPSACPRA